MLLGARIQAVIDIVEEVTKNLFPADRACAHYYRNNRFVGSKDRLYIGNTVFDVFRQWGQLQWLLDNRLSPRRGVLLHILLNDRLSLRALDEILEASDKFIKPLNHNEHDILEGCLQKMQSAELPLWALYSYPEWLEDELRHSLKRQFEEEMRALAKGAPMTLRANTLKTNREVLLKELTQEVPSCKPTAFSPWGIVCAERWRADQHKLFREGHFEIQDEASQMCALVVDAKPGEKIIDYCAGAGGKTLALAALMNNKGQLYATDIDATKLEEAQKRLRRNGVHNAQCKPLDAATRKWLDKHAGTFDRVLVDAPCSGSGTWRRNPDAKWKLTPAALANLELTQSTLLEQAAQLVRVGGFLIYSTCSLLYRENNQRIERFLSTHKNFDIVNPNISEKLTTNDFMQSLPAQHGMDGFFAAKLQKSSY